MSDDRKDEQIAKLPSDGAPESPPPFVPNDDSANFVALSGRSAQMASAGALTTNAQVFPPFITTTKAVLYVDFGFTSA